jgi:transposase-like protein
MASFPVYIILLYVRYVLSYRDLEEMMLERRLPVDHTTIYRWVQGSAPELEKRCRPHLKATNDSWRVDETYLKFKKPGPISTEPSTRKAILWNSSLV